MSFLSKKNENIQTSNDIWPLGHFKMKLVEIGWTNEYT